MTICACGSPFLRRRTTAGALQLVCLSCETADATTALATTARGRPSINDIRRRRFAAATRDELRAAYERVHTVRALAIEYRVSVSQARRRLIADDLLRPSGVCNYMPGSRRAELHALSREALRTLYAHLTSTEIAADYRVAPQTVTTLLGRHRIKRRSRRATGVFLLRSPERRRALLAIAMRDGVDDGCVRVWLDELHSRSEAPAQRAA